MFGVLGHLALTSHMTCPLGGQRIGHGCHVVGKNRYGIGKAIFRPAAQCLYFPIVQSDTGLLAVGATTRIKAKAPDILTSQ